MTVNTEKTEVMVIKAATFVGPLRPVLFGEKQLRVVTTAKCLGVTIDNNMTWKNQITKVSNQYNAKLSHLRRIRYLPRHILETIYYKCIISTVTYCIAVWGTCTPVMFQELEKKHIRAAKLIYNIHNTELSAEQVLQQVNWRSLGYIIYKKRLLSIMHDIYHKRTHPDVLELFRKSGHNKTRSRNNFEIIRPRTEIGRNSIRIRGPQAWNSLTNDMREPMNKDTFKMKLKHYKNLDNISFSKETSCIKKRNSDYFYF